MLGILHRLSTPVSAGEPSALQVLRRMPPAQTRQAMAALQALPALGPGEPLAPAVRLTMERILGRDFSGVRVFTAPVAEMLGAEAFTSGERIVFAPGRMDLRSARGLALVGHELSHVGQALAFKQAATFASMPPDDEEHRARQQEQTIRHIIEHGWPAGPRLEVRRVAPPLAPLAGNGGDVPGVSVGRGPGGLAVARVEQPATGGAGGIAARGSATPAGRAGEAGEAAGRETTAPAAVDVEALARQVYAILKSRLRAERDRHHVYR